MCPGLIEAQGYERLCCNSLKDRSQLAIDTAIVSINCKANRRFGKTLSSPYSTMNVRRSSGLDNTKLARTNTRVLQPRIYSYNCLLFGITSEPGA